MHPYIHIYMCTHTYARRIIAGGLEYNHMLLEINVYGNQGYTETDALGFMFKPASMWGWRKAVTAPSNMNACTAAPLLIPQRSLSVSLCLSLSSYPQHKHCVSNFSSCEVCFAVHLVYICFYFYALVV